MKFRLSLVLYICLAIFLLIACDNVDNLVDAEVDAIEDIIEEDITPVPQDSSEVNQRMISAFYLDHDAFEDNDSRR